MIDKSQSRIMSVISPAVYFIQETLFYFHFAMVPNDRFSIILCSLNVGRVYGTHEDNNGTNIAT